MTANEQGLTGASVEREGIWRKQGVQERGIRQKGGGTAARDGSLSKRACSTGLVACV